MLVVLRRDFAHLVTSGAQLMLLLVGFKLESRNGWLVILGIMATISLFAWLAALNRLRTIRDTPTSKVASAAQGYVELIGRGKSFGDPLISKLNALPCLWYRYKIEKKDSGNKWRTVDKGESCDSFMLHDETGECVVDIDDAEIITRHCDHWSSGNYRYTEWKLIAQDRIYAIGEFRTRSGALEFNSREQLNALLGEWKKDMSSLNARFDLDNNGVLDMREWMLARSAAKREVRKMMRDAQEEADIHIIGRPRDGKLFLISNLTPDRLSQRFLLWSWAHLVIFFGALGGIAWMLQATHL